MMPRTPCVFRPSVFKCGLLCSVLLVASIGLLAQSGPSSADCNRACLQSLADDMLASMPAHNAARLPLAANYAATENLVPSVPAMMSVWRTVTEIKAKYYVLDPVSQQLFLVVTVAEGRNDALLYGRLALLNRRIAELELYINRSRGQSGLMFDPQGPAHLKGAWIASISEDRRPTRSALLEAGRSMFDATLSAPPASPQCSVIETGRDAELSTTLQATVTQTAVRPMQLDRSNDKNEKAVPVSCENVAHRPSDPDARADIVDEVKGIVVGIAVVHGTTSSYLIPRPPESNFLPDGYYERYRLLQEKQKAALDPDTPILRPTKATAAVSQIYRIYDGRIQGFQRFILVMPEGVVSPWRKPK